MEGHEKYYKHWAYSRQGIRRSRSASLANEYELLYEKEHRMISE